MTIRSWTRSCVRFRSFQARNLFPAEPAYRDSLAMAYHSMGSMLKSLGRWPEAEQALRRSQTLLEGLVEELPAEPLIKDFPNVAE